jgi:hypothetical protein
MLFTCRHNCKEVSARFTSPVSALIIAFMEGHHLILGKLTDLITGNTLEDTHDERYRQNLARLLLYDKGFDRASIQPRYPLQVRAGTNCALIPIDFVVSVGDKIGMIVKYAPGSLVTRYRPALAAARLVAPYQVPRVVITNGETADILDGPSGKRLASGLASIPDKDALELIVAQSPLAAIASERAEIEARIVYAFEVDDACPCDDTVCRL